MGIAYQYPIESCKAAIAVMNNVKPKIMKGEKLEENLYHVKYNRPSDGKLWQWRCKVVGDTKLQWAAFDAFGDGEQGRWRDEDEIVVGLKGDKLTVWLNQGTNGWGSIGDVSRDE